MKHIAYFVLAVILVGAIGCSGSAPASNPTAVPTNVPPSLAPVTTAPQATVASQATNAPAPTSQIATAAPAIPTGAPTVVSGAGGGLKPPEGAPLDIVKQASLKAFEASSLRAKTVIDAADGSHVTLLVEYVRPDRVHVVQPDGGEIIAIKGKGAWQKKDDQWTPMGAQAADMFFGFLEPAAIEEMLKLIQTDSVQFVGPELLDGKPMFVYTYKTTLNMGTQPTQASNKIWLGALDGRAYRVETNSDSLAVAGKQDHTVATYEYDSPITIEAPQ